MSISLTCFQGNLGDSNPLGIEGAAYLAQELAQRTGLSCHTFGQPDSIIQANWQTHLERTTPELLAYQSYLDGTLAGESGMLLAVHNRCAVSLATLPVMAKYHPDVCVIWIDAHADLNTPQSSASGYLGGMALSGPCGLWNSGLGAGVNLQSVVLVGQRDIDVAEQSLINEQHIVCLPPGPTLLPNLRDVIQGRKLWVHLDCDVLQPGIVPTEYLCPDGLTLDDLRAISTVLATEQVIGLEIAECQTQATGRPAETGPLIDALWPIIYTDSGDKQR